MIHVLVVEDDARLNRIVCTYLNDSGFHATGCLSAGEAYDEMYNNLYELIISDIMMPGIDGFEFAQTVRQVNKRIPILFMSARDDLPAKQKGFQLGIDDYMVKPVVLEELLMRVRALLRRANIEMERRLIVGNLELDADAMTAAIDGEEIAVTTREPKPEPYDLCAQLCSCALQFEDMWDQKDMEFEADLEGRVSICGDSGLLELVWTNLLSNAVKFTPAGGTISIRQTSDTDGVTVEIRDTGCGMEEATMKRIFDKFYQGDTSHATEGNGLGLALVQRILELSEGTITVSSAPGKGTAFTVRLPKSMHTEEVGESDNA